MLDLSYHNARLRLIPAARLFSVSLGGFITFLLVNCNQHLGELVQLMYGEVSSVFNIKTNNRVMASFPRQPARERQPC